MDVFLDWQNAQKQNGAEQGHNNRQFVSSHGLEISSNEQHYQFKFQMLGAKRRVAQHNSDPSAEKCYCPAERIINNIQSVSGMLLNSCNRNIDLATFDHTSSSPIDRHSDLQPQIQIEHHSDNCIDDAMDTVEQPSRTSKTVSPDTYQQYVSQGNYSPRQVQSYCRPSFGMDDSSMFSYHNDYY